MRSAGGGGTSSHAHGVYVGTDVGGGVGTAVGYGVRHVPPSVQAAALCEACRDERFGGAGGGCLAISPAIGF